MESPMPAAIAKPPVAPAQAVRGSAPAVTRSQRKQLTREQLMAAALKLMGEGRGFSSLSLREITREAGVVPAAFYRHFHDMDELGLALVDGCGATLRRLLREARQGGLSPTHIIRSSVRIFNRYVEANRLYFRFASGERGGGSPVIRKAIRVEESHFANEMAQDLRALGLLSTLSTRNVEMICGLVVTTMMTAAIDLLDMPQRQPLLEQELADTFVRQLRLIFLGAAVWRDTPPRR